MYMYMYVCMYLYFKWIFMNELFISYFSLFNKLLIEFTIFLLHFPSYCKKFFFTKCLYYFFSIFCCFTIFYIILIYL